MLTPKKSQLEVFVEKLPEAPALMLSFLTDSRSSTRFPAVTRLTVHRRRQLADPTKRDNVLTWGRFLKLCARFDNSFSENGFFSHTVSYGAPAGKIFRALGAILLKDLQEPTLPAVQFGR